VRVRFAVRWLPLLSRRHPLGLRRPDEACHARPHPALRATFSRKREKKGLAYARFSNSSVPAAVLEIGMW
jgi:hypothetical protein